MSLNSSSLIRNIVSWDTSPCQPGSGLFSTSEAASIPAMASSTTVPVFATSLTYTEEMNGYTRLSPMSQVTSARITPTSERSYNQDMVRSCHNCTIATVPATTVCELCPSGPNKSSYSSPAHPNCHNNNVVEQMGPLYQHTAWIIGQIHQ